MNIKYQTLPKYLKFGGAVIAGTLLYLVFGPKEDKNTQERQSGRSIDGINDNFEPDNKIGDMPQIPTLFDSYRNN